MKPHPIVSGEWQEQAQLADYRSEWLSNVLVERATWTESAEPQFLREIIDDVTVAGPGYVWLRFWLKDEEQVLEKYFAADGEVVGFYVPVGMPFRQEGSVLSVQPLALALWYDMAGRLTILGETEFESNARHNVFAPVEVEHAEHRIRELTMSVLNRSFPPGLVRNFSVAVESEAEESSPDAVKSVDGP